MSESSALIGRSSGGNRGIVLVEGASDRAAIEAGAVVLGMDLVTRDVTIVDMGGITNVGAHLSDLAREPATGRIAILCDEAEVGVVARARRAHRDLGAVFVCRADLEHELIRAAGPAGIVEVIEAAGESRAWRVFTGQPHQRDRGEVERLHRFFGTKSGRKERYAGLIVERLTPERIPLPLRAVITFAATAGSPA